MENTFNIIINWIKVQEKIILEKGERIDGMMFMEMSKFAACFHNQDTLSKIRVMYVDEIPLPKELYQILGWKGLVKGLTCGYGVYIDKKYKGDITVVSHEFIHVLQHIECGGIDNFIYQYINQYTKYGYIEMPFEKVAREKSIKSEKKYDSY